MKELRRNLLSQFTKTIEIAILCVFFPYLLRDLTALTIPLANALGIIMATIVVYWIPPISRTGFLKWMITGLVAAALLFAYSSVIDHL